MCMEIHLYIRRKANGIQAQSPNQGKSGSPRALGINVYNIYFSTSNRNYERLESAELDTRQGILPPTSMKAATLGVWSW